MPGTPPSVSVSKLSVMLIEERSIEGLGNCRCYIYIFSKSLDLICDDLRAFVFVFFLQV